MTQDEAAVLRVVVEAGEPLPAREVAARLYGITPQQAVDSGRSVEASKTLIRLAAVNNGRYIAKDYPAGVTYVAYYATPQGQRAIRDLP